MKVAVAANERGEESRQAADAVPAGAAVAETRAKADKQSAHDQRRRIGLDYGRGRREEEARDEGRNNQAEGRQGAPLPVARARRNEPAEQPRGAEDASVFEDQPRRREPDENAAGQGGAGGEVSPVDRHRCSLSPFRPIGWKRLSI